MKKFIKTLIAGAIAAATLSAGAAWASHKPDPCRVDHDHRSHAADYYNYYPSDRYSRAGAYRQSGVTFSISFGDDDYDRRDRRHRSDDRHRHHRNDRYDDRGPRNGYKGQRGRTVNREVFDTRYRARIILTEQIVRTRHGQRLLCTVDARGPQARYVPNKRLRKVARRNCSRRAEIRIIT